MVNIKYWDLISIDKLSFEKGLVILRLSHKLATIIRTCIGIVEVLPKRSTGQAIIKQVLEKLS